MKLDRSVSVTNWVLRWRQIFDLQEQKEFACTNSVQIGSRATQPPVQRVREGAIQAKRRLVHIRPSRANLKNVWRYASIRPYVFTSWYLNTKCSFSSPYTSFRSIRKTLNTFSLKRHIRFFHPYCISFFGLFFQVFLSFCFLFLSFPYIIFFPLFITKTTVLTTLIITPTNALT